MHLQVVVFFEVDPPVKLGGNNGRNRVEADSMRKGRSAKGPHGHRSRVICDLFGMRGVDTLDGRKKIILKP